MSATLSSKLYQKFRMKYTLIQKKIQPKEFHRKTRSSKNRFVPKQFHPKAVSSQNSFTHIPMTLSSKMIFIQKHIVNVQPNALPWTGIAPDPHHPKFRTVFPLPTFSSYSIFQHHEAFRGHVLVVWAFSLKKNAKHTFGLSGLQIWQCCVEF